MPSIMELHAKPSPVRQRLRYSNYHSSRTPNNSISIPLTYTSVHTSLSSLSFPAIAPPSPLSIPLSPMIAALKCHPAIEAVLHARNMDLVRGFDVVKGRERNSNSNTSLADANCKSNLSAFSILGRKDSGLGSEMTMESRGAGKGEELVFEIENRGWDLERKYVRGMLLRMEGDTEGARACYRDVATRSACLLEEDGESLLCAVWGSSSSPSSTRPCEMEISDDEGVHMDMDIDFNKERKAASTTPLEKAKNAALHFIDLVEIWMREPRCTKAEEKVLEEMGRREWEAMLAWCERKFGTRSRWEEQVEESRRVPDWKLLEEKLRKMST